jgi:hypothetical protein
MSVAAPGRDRQAAGFSDPSSSKVALASKTFFALEEMLGQSPFPRSQSLLVARLE